MTGIPVRLFRRNKFKPYFMIGCYNDKRTKTKNFKNLGLQSISKVIHDCDLIFMCYKLNYKNA